MPYLNEIIRKNYKKQWDSKNKDSQRWIKRLGTTDLSEHMNPDFKREQEIITNEKKRVLNGRKLNWNSDKVPQLHKHAFYSQDFNWMGTIITNEYGDVTKHNVFEQELSE